MTFDDALIHPFYPNRKDFERLVRKNMSHNKWIDFKQTDIFLKELFERTPIEQLTKEERRKIEVIIDRRSHEVWDLLLAGCVSEAIDTHPDISHAKRQAFAWNRAECLMIEEYLIPPHFTKEGRCLNCGPVLLPESAIDVAPVSCPWCALGLMKASFYNEEKVNYEQ